MAVKPFNRTPVRSVTGASPPSSPFSSGRVEARAASREGKSVRAQRPAVPALRASPAATSTRSTFRPSCSSSYSRCLMPRKRTHSQLRRVTHPETTPHRMAGVATMARNTRPRNNANASSTTRFRARDSVFMRTGDRATATWTSRRSRSFRSFSKGAVPVRLM